VRRYLRQRCQTGLDATLVGALDGVTKDPVAEAVVVAAMTARSTKEIV
jgi:hypothetical protein